MRQQVLVDEVAHLSRVLPVPGAVRVEILEHALRGSLHDVARALIRVRRGGALGSRSGSRSLALRVRSQAGREQRAGE